MVVTVKCQACGTSLKLRQGFAKSLKEFKCLKCGAMIPLEGSAGGSPAPLPPPKPAPDPLPTAAPDRPVSADTIAVECSGCKRSMNLRPALAGKKIRCKECGAITLVPEAPKTAAPSPAAPPIEIPPPPPPAPAVPKSEPKTIVLPVEAVQPPVPEEKTIVLPPSAAGLPDSADDLKKTLANCEERLAERGKALAEAILRAEKAENALRTIAGQHAIEKADLQHQVEELKAKLGAAGPAIPPTLVASLDNLVAMQAESLKARVEEIKKSLG